MDLSIWSKTPSRRTCHEHLTQATGTLAVAPPPRIAFPCHSTAPRVELVVHWPRFPLPALTRASSRAGGDAPLCFLTANPRRAVNEVPRNFFMEAFSRCAFPCFVAHLSAPFLPNQKCFWKLGLHICNQRTFSPVFPICGAFSHIPAFCRSPHITKRAFKDNSLDHHEGINTVTANNSFPKVCPLA